MLYEVITFVKLKKRYIFITKIMRFWLSLFDDEFAAVYNDLVA